MIVALGPIVAAFIDTDPITTSTSEMSRRSIVHAGLGALFILGFPVAATVVGISTAGTSKWGPLLAWASVVPWAALAWFVWRSVRTASPDGRATREVRIGWPNRVSMVAYLAWVGLAGLAVRG